MKKKFTFPLFLFFVVLFLEDCSGLRPYLHLYEGKKLPKTEVGIFHWDPLIWEISTVNHLHFWELDKLDEFESIMDCYGYAMLPGDYIITIDPAWWSEYRLQRIRGHALLKFNVKPGHRYTPKFVGPETETRGSWEIYSGSLIILDESTNEIVSEVVEPFIIVTNKNRETEKFRYNNFILINSNQKEEKIITLMNTDCEPIKIRTQRNEDWIPMIIKKNNIFTIRSPEKIWSDCANKNLNMLRVYIRNEEYDKDGLLRVTYFGIKGFCESIEFVCGENFESGEEKKIHIDDISRIDFVH